MEDREAILTRIARGDADAVAACLDEYGGLVYSLARRYLAAVGGDLEEGVQEVFVEVWRSAGRFDPAKASEAAFVATIAHRRLIDARRRAARRYALSADESLQPAAPAMKPVAELRDEARRVAEAMEQIRPEEREVLRLSICEGLTHERIAVATSTPLGTVKTRIRSGLERLRRAVFADERNEGAR